MGIRQSLREAGRYVRAVSGLVVAVITLPVYINRVARDFEDMTRYANQPGTIFYNPKKPTPNTEDFPDRVPSLDRVRRYSDWMIRTFIPNS